MSSSFSHYLPTEDAVEHRTVSDCSCWCGPQVSAHAGPTRELFIVMHNACSDVIYNDHRDRWREQGRVVIIDGHDDPDRDNMPVRYPPWW